MSGLPEAPDVGGDDKVKNTPKGRCNTRRYESLEAQTRVRGRSRAQAHLVLGGPNAPRQDGEDHQPPDDDIGGDNREPGHRGSDLLKLDERAAEGLRMQEEHGLVMGAKLGLAVAQYPSALGLELIARCADVLDLQADVMHPARGVAVEEAADRRILAERLQ